MINWPKPGCFPHSQKAMRSVG